MKIFITLSIYFFMLQKAIGQEIRTLPRTNDDDSSSMREFRVVEEMPQFPGGSAQLLKFIQENLQYPQALKDSTNETKIIIQFLVKEDGSLDKFKIVRSIHPLFDAEAIRVLKLMPKWTPGMQRGKPVPVWFTLPVIFELREKYFYENTLIPFIYFFYDTNSSWAR